MVGPKSLLTRHGKEGVSYFGFPARPEKEWRRSVAHVNGLDKFIKRVNRLLGKEKPEDNEG